MKVSFGQLYTVKECAFRTSKQREIEEKTDDVFESRFAKNGINTFNYPRTLSEMLSEDMLVDIRLTHKKNGDVELKLEEQEHCFSIMDNIIKEKDKIKLTLTADMTKREIAKKLNQFANNCRKLAKFYDKQFSNIGAERLRNL